MVSMSDYLSLSKYPRKTIFINHSLRIFSEVTTSLQKREVNLFSVFLCQGCRELWRGILVTFSELHIFQGLGLQSGILHAKNGVKYQNVVQKRSQKVMVMKFEVLRVKHMVEF